MEMDVKEKVKATLMNLLKLKHGELNDDGKLYEDIGVDSTEMVEIITALEKVFKVELFAKEITKFSTVNDIEAVIKAKL